MGYFLYTFAAQSCKTTKEVEDAGGQVVENSNGTVSVYSPNGLPRPITKPCCERLNPSYTFDIDKQECIWGEASCPTTLETFNVVLNPEGNDGAIFEVDFETKETCILDVSFDYLFKFDCTKVLTTLNNINAGLTDEEIALCRDLDILKEDLETSITTQESDLTILLTTLENTPYVIVCENDSGSETGGPVQIEPQTPIKSGNRLPDSFSSNSPLSPPTAFPVTNEAGSYCLTDLGLQSWETILGTVNYNTWVNSNGTNITVYGCDEVNQLIALDNGTGTLLGSCLVSITERQEIITNITSLQSTINRDKELLSQTNQQIEDLCGGVNCNTFVEMLENLNVCITLDMVDQNTNSLVTVYEEPLFNVGDGNLYNYLISSSGHTGFYVTAATQTNDCGILGSQLLSDLANENALTLIQLQELQSILAESFDSNWVNFTTSITDPNVISLITNQKVKISLKVKNTCVDFCILIDRINMNKRCTRIDSNTVQISTCPSFDLIRVCDNKKSWVTNENFKHRDFDLKHRDTQYDINNYKLALNSKEVDLDINPAHAIEQDVFCYIQDNPCLLDCSTGTTSVTCEIDFDFEAILSAETYSCDSGFTSACTVNSIWGIEVILGCETIYNNNSFYTSTGLTDTPTITEYVNELSGIATTLGLVFTTGATSVTFTDMVDCEGIKFLGKTFTIDLSLDVTTNCGTTKLFQNGVNFEFQDLEDYDFN